MGLLDDVGAYLVSQGCGTLGTDLFLGGLQETDDTPVLAVLEYGGEPGVPVFGPGPTSERPRFQLLGRAKAYQDARAKVEAAYVALDQSVFAGVQYVEALQPPFHMGEDERLRPLIACNFRSIRRHGQRAT